MKPSNRLLWWGGLVLGILVLLTFLGAPSTSKINSGSTYSRAPDGYGAWYAFMEEQGTPVKRWQKPFRNLLQQEGHVTLLQVSQQPSELLLSSEEGWVEKGNTLVILGVNGQVTPAAFTTIQQSSVGGVQIATRRRRQLQDKEKQRLGDSFGATVWEQPLGQGRVILSVTPYIGANAYQDNISNYKYLAQVVTQYHQPILVDEYIHGYKDKTVKERENEQNWVAYLMKTPLFPAFLQSGVLLLVFIWAQNRRFGPPQPLETPVIDNSEAYIQALAEVLQKAECSEFVLDVVGKDEQLQLQKALGLGTSPLQHQTLIDAWVQQTGGSAAELQQLLQQQSQKERIRKQDLLSWLGKWQEIKK